MKILLIVAMESELQGFLDNQGYATRLILGHKVYQKDMGSKNIFLTKCEVGKVNAASLTTAMTLKLKPSYVINAGIGGGLSPNINLLDVVGSTSLAYHDFDLTAFNLKKGALDKRTLFFKAADNLVSLLDENVKKGLIVSGDQFVSGKDSLNKIKEYFPNALVCDMEGAAIAHTCKLLSRKFIVLRAISDNVFLENHLQVYEDYKPKAIEKVVQVTYDLIAKIK